MANEKVYVLDDGENQREGMTKEQILAAIAEAISTGQVTGDYSAFIEMIKEQNKGVGIKMWVGTQAELLALPEIEADTIYYVSDLSTLADLDNALAELKEQLTDGSFKVGKAGAADNVTGQIAGKAISAIFESNGTTAKEATHAGSADEATHAGSADEATHAEAADEATHADSADTANNVTGQIAGKAITAIFESNGTTAKEATTIGKYQHNISFEFSENSYNGRIRFSFITSYENPIEYDGEIINTMKDYIDFPIMATGWASVGTAGFFIPDCVQLNDEAGLLIIAGLYYNFHNNTCTTDYQIELTSSGVERWIDRVIKL